MKRDFENDLFKLLVAECDNGELAAFALYYHRYSTWTGKCLYLEDLYVKGPHRGHGVGTGLLQKLREIAAKGDCGRLQWQCLDWNTNAVKFYKEKFDADIETCWLDCTIRKEELEKYK